ncbi:TPA: glycosyltransferase family 4 protein [Bacillus toyonensis]|uniref:glycosyltransferase family 4 protein n=1 Tax=Bacillus toyonensis TaxID=155322 RepID=UPI000BF00173|nr:glycosyltransferase family 4 protein [Bacillus toyonensis]PEO66117.1 group 1 glycosyl transferase [Bacillus toyonensis]PFX76645.1 group 1 glycosyl transferase [Bacillus toyonensis]PFX88632.1 group 1 glycosyl transferase [Bacillus toyonensis]PGB06553.1 group 1 glycosyl transferase [Bacillus toyonensis]PHB57870.1 group 1 glycosyl transferase [Bacillus toyonensis]
MKKVLMINKFFYVRGGAEKYMFDLSDELNNREIDIVPFSMKDPKNRETKYDQYFVNNVSYDGEINIFNKISYGLKSIYSSEARKKIGQLLDVESPDIAHLHNYNYQLTPSILYELKKRNIPVVQTLHDPQVICPHHRLYDFNRNSICEDCKGHKYFNAVKNKCIKSSYLASALGAIESTVYHYLKTYEKNIDLFISPSEFLKDKIIEFGVLPEKIKVIPNFVDSDYWNYNEGNKGYILFIGRLSEEKGIQILIEAMKQVPDLKLKIAGTGPLSSWVDKIVKMEKLENVEILGYQSGEKLKQLLEESMATVIPAKWYENCPISILESYSCGKPVIGSNLGGIPDMVHNGETGLLFETGNIQDLVNKLKYVQENPDEMLDMGRKSRKLIETMYNKHKHVDDILKIYKEVIEDENNNTRN